MASQIERQQVSLKEGRFARFESIEWWEQSRVAGARILVVGAGALGNEVVKNLALLGVGQFAVADMDHIELSNLSRSVLFRAGHEGLSKAARAVQSASEIYPDAHAIALEGNVLAAVGLGWFRWADAVIGAVDNREARLFVNSACARVGKPWFDGGIEVLNGIVRGFAAPQTACYECTMGETDWTLLNRRRSCSLLARRAVAEHGTPTTPTTASVIGAMQVQEVLKCLHGMEALLGEGFVFDGLAHTSYRVKYPINPECPWHEPAPIVERLPDCGSATPMEAVWSRAALLLGGVDGMDLSRELVERTGCPHCGEERELFESAETISGDRLICPRCHVETVPVFFHSIGPGSPLLQRTPRQLGLPPWDIVWARRGEKLIGMELSGDEEECLRGTIRQKPV